MKQITEYTNDGWEVVPLGEYKVDAGYDYQKVTVTANPDLLKIMALCRSKGVIPNLTTNGMGVDALTAAYLAYFCGAVAVSHYGMDDVCFDAIAKLSEAGLKQVNIHKLLSEETLPSCFKLIDQAWRLKLDENGKETEEKESQETSDPRLQGMKAIVFLLLKPKGNRNHMTSIKSVESYRKLLAYAMEKRVPVGMDSCSAPMALKSLPAQCIPSIEPCESTLFSIYVDVAGRVYPCSFTQGTPGWETGIDLVGEKDFLKDVWFGPRLEAWRQGLLKSSESCNGCSVQQHCRSCPVYNVTVCKPVPEKLLAIGASV